MGELFDVGVRDEPLIAVCDRVDGQGVKSDDIGQTKVKSTVKSVPSVVATADGRLLKRVKNASSVEFVVAEGDTYNGILRVKKAFRPEFVHHVVVPDFRTVFIETFDWRDLTDLRREVAGILDILATNKVQRMDSVVVSLAKVPKEEWNRLRQLLARENIASVLCSYDLYVAAGLRT